MRLWLGRIRVGLEKRIDDWNRTRILENAMASRQRYEIMQALGTEHSERKSDLTTLAAVKATSSITGLQRHH